MSETATIEAPAAVTPAVAEPSTTAPAVTEVLPPPTPARALTTGMDARREAREAMQRDREAARQVAEPKRDPATGQFVPAAGAPPEVAAVAPVAPEAPAAETRAAAAPTDPAAAAKRPEPIRVEIPQDHPIRAMGRDAITASDPHEAQMVQALLNGVYVRKQALETVTAERDALREKVLRSEAGDAANAKWKGTPEYAQALEQYRQISEEVSPEAAAKFWAGEERALHELTEKEYAARTNAIATQESEKAGLAWRQQAWQRVQGVSNEIKSLPEYGQWFAKSLDAFEALVDRGHYDAQCGNDPEKYHEAFLAFYAKQLQDEPKVQAVFERRAAAAKPPAPAAPAAAPAVDVERIKREAIEEHMRGLAGKRVASPAHPLGNMGGVPRAPNVGTETPVIPANVSPHEARRLAKAGVREDVRRYSQ